MSRLSGGEPGTRPFVNWLDRYGVAACFVWGFAEAVLFFIVPDVIVGAVALYVPRKWWRATAAAIAGSLVGGVLLYLVVTVVGTAMRDVIDGIPGVTTLMITQVQADLAELGGIALVAAPLSGIPFKIYVAEMALGLGSLGSLLLWTIPARAVRIVPVGVAAGAVGHWLRGPIRRWPRTVLVLYVAWWLVVYVLYFATNGL